ncbi:MAG: hypothetical protein Q9191_000833 [Dirinaria sp. TL-2023a]
MPATGVYFVPARSAQSSPFTELFNRLNSQYDTSPLPNWTLDHRLFRETPSPSAPVSLNLAADEQPKPSATRYLQVLGLSHLPGRSYVAITTVFPPSQTRVGTPASSTVSSSEISGEPATIVSIPAGNPSHDFLQLLNAKFGPLWTQRQSLSVRNGQAFQVADYNIRIGELVQGYGPGAALARGAIVEIAWTGGQGKEPVEEPEAFVQAFWESLEIKGARESVHVAGLGEGDGLVRQWCEALRIRN